MLVTVSLLQDPAALDVSDVTGAWPVTKACLRFIVATACRFSEWPRCQRPETSLQETQAITRSGAPLVAIFAPRKLLDDRRLIPGRTVS